MFCARNECWWALRDTANDNPILLLYVPRYYFMLLGSIISILDEEDQNSCLHGEAQNVLLLYLAPDGCFSNLHKFEIISRYQT